MKNSLILLAFGLLSACTSTSPPPDWKANAFAALNSYTSAYLSGDTRVADFELARAKTEIARTGRPDLMARAELVRCAAQVASLDFTPCTGYATRALDAQPAEQAYAAFISGQWNGINAALLPVHYRGLVAQALQNAQQPAPGAASANHQATGQAISQATSPFSNQLSQIQDPLSRLIAAGMLFKKELLTPTDIGLAVETASNQGWRRPLLSWLGVQQQRAQAAGDAAALASLQRRIDLVLQKRP